MSTGELKHLLQGLADDGAELVELDKERLVPRIRSRRRRRASLTAAVAASTAVLLAAAAHAVLPGGAQEQPPVVGATLAPAPTVTITSAKMLGWEVCGASLKAPMVGGPGLRLSVTARSVTRTDPGTTAWIGVQLTNTTDRTLDLASAPDGPRMVVVKDGVVVAVPPREQMASRRWLFLPRQTATVMAALSVRPCGTNRDLLESGSYQIYALKTFNENRPGYALFQLQAAGGPWTIELR